MNGLLPSAIPYAIDNGMKEILTMDASGRLVLPKQVRRQLHIPAQAAFRVEVAGNRVELTLVEDGTPRLKRKGGLLIAARTGKKFDAVEAIAETRGSRL